MEEKKQTSKDGLKHFKVENFEEHNYDKIVEEIKKQQEEKLQRIQKDLDNYTEKLTESSKQLEQLRKDLKKVNGQQSVGIAKQIKELESKNSRFKSQVAHFERRQASVSSELQKIIAGGDLNESSFMDMFSVKD